MRFRLVLVIAVLLSFLPIHPIHPIQTARADEHVPLPIEWALQSYGGRFYRQTSEVDGAGYVVSDQDGVTFWDVFRKFGPGRLGYPISQRFEWNGRVTQVFQRGALQFDPVDEQVEIVNLLDALTTGGYDGWLETNYGIPSAGSPEELPGGDTLGETVRARLKLLDAEPKLSAFYYRAPDPYSQPVDPIALYGAPTSEVQEIGAARSIRLQRGVLQLWLEDVPWAKTGEVTTVEIGSIAYRVGLFPSGEHWNAVQAPEGPPPRPIIDENVRMDPATVEIPPGYRWVDVNLSRQRVYAMVDDYPIFWAPVTTGRANPTPVGRHRIFSRVFNETMDSTTLGIPRNGPGGWYLPNVYFTQYFYPGGYALHANYWAAPSIFGNAPSSAGCVGMLYDDARFFWDFANLGTEVVVHY